MAISEIIYSINYGGLCNRINNLINSIYLSKCLQRSLVIYWPINQACNCRYDDLFENDYKIVYLSGQDQELVNYEDYIELFGDNCTFYKKSWKDLSASNNGFSNIRSFDHFKNHSELLNDMRKVRKDVLVQSSRILPSIPPLEMLKGLKQLILKKEINNSIIAFCENNNINKDVIGAHARQTDAAIIREDFYVHKIDSFLRKKNTQRMFFCSDSKELEIKIKETFGQRLIINPKDHYPVKLNDSCEWVTSSQGVGKYNIFRSVNSVKEALIDLHLLGQTTFRVRSFGSFSTIGYYLSLINQNHKCKISRFADFKISHYNDFQRFVYAVDKIKFAMNNISIW